MKKDEKFILNYSAKQQKEIDRIREKYIPKKENTLDEMRKLDEKVTQKASIVAISIGFASTLILGVGMSCTMVWQDTLFLLGIIIGSIGLLGIALTLPLYTYVLKKERAKVAERIIQLSEIAQNDDIKPSINYEKR